MMQKRRMSFLLVMLFIVIGGCRPKGETRTKTGETVFCIGAENDVDWIVIQYTDHSSVPFNCWKINKTCLMIGPLNYNTGIAWENASGHLIWITGRYNAVRVANSNYEEAAKSIGIELNRCQGGKYVTDENSGGTMPK